MADTDTQRLDLDALVAKWQPILRLQDWDFKPRYCRRWEMSDNAAGDCDFLAAKRHCTIRVMEPCDYPPTWIPPIDVELTVVHEMLHPFVATFHPNDFDNAQMEPFIHAMSSALVGLHRAADIVRS
jgi:hypothetical protein